MTNHHAQPVTGSVGSRKFVGSKDGKLGTISLDDQKCDTTNCCFAVVTRVLRGIQVDFSPPQKAEPTTFRRDLRADCHIISCKPYG